MARYLALVFILLGAPAAADTCSDLATNLSVATLPNTTITSAATVSGAFTPPNGGMPIEGLPSFCRVTATLKPGAASDIKIEIWMPSSGWNGKFEAVGNGGLGGTISYTNLPNYLDHASLETQKSARLFLIPGMGHCGGGPGADTFDAIGTLDQWVDRGVAPDKIIASHAAPAYTRPLCAYPQDARYNGSGDRTDARNWKCVSETKP